MAIFGIFGGIGSGKTMTGVYLAIKDLFDGKTVYSNTKFRNIPPKFRKNIKYIDKHMMENLFNMIKDKKVNMKNSTVFIQEMHNYADSRNATSNKNKVFSYWILQSRHTGEGSCDIIYDTQRIGQVDLRLRNNTDYKLYPEIVKRIDDKNKTPYEIKVTLNYMKGQTFKEEFFSFPCSEAMKYYDTHEIVYF